MLHPSQNEGTSEIGRHFDVNRGIAISAKFRDFLKAITLLLINAHGFGIVGIGSGRSLQTIDFRVPATNTAANTPTYKNTHPHTHVHKCITFKFSDLYCRLSRLDIELWNCKWILP